MSSYMLENIYQFRANISTILNLAEDHIDRHKNLLNYINSKYNIIRYSQKNDFFLKNIDNPITKKRTFSLNTSITELTFSNEKSSLNNRNIDYYYDKNTDTFIGKHLSLKNPKKKMNCNIHNTSILFALAVLEYLNLSIKTCKKYFYSFNPLPHRLEKVDLSFNRKLTIYNDSKATTPQAVSSALENLKGNITLILGGKDKNLSFKILKPYLNKVNQLFIYGEARNKIANQLKDFPVINIEEDFKTIVKNAWQSTNPEEILVLSPGCSSFDQFSNFEKRGDFFKELVLQLDKNVL